jgi:hypothetical protein
MTARAPGPAAGKRLLFWDDQAGALQPILDFLGVVPGGKTYGQPKDHVRRDVPWDDRETVGKALQLRSTMNPTGGDVLMGYMGFAECRICGERLGTRDFFGHGFVWPEKADHYVLVHSVWTKECDELLAAVRRAGRRAP